jgi:hypothetical protein
VRIQVRIIRRNSKAGVHKTANVAHSRKQVRAGCRRNERLDGCLLNSVGQRLESYVVDSVPLSKVATAENSCAGTCCGSFSVTNTYNPGGLAIKPVVGIQWIDGQGLHHPTNLEANQILCNIWALTYLLV